MVPDPILEIKNLKIEFHLNKIVTAVYSAELNIKEGETVVLIGESGSGKTITALSICRILPANAKIVSGQINFAGKEMLGLNENELRGIRGRDIVYIFQEPVSFLNPLFTIGSQIVEIIMLHQEKNKKEAYKEAINLLEKVKISDAERVFGSYPHQLSGGMNQRAFIAMGLACNPKLLIADEPTTSLDVTIEKEILDLLLDLKNKLRFSLLFITHNLSIAKKIAERIFVMYKGRVVEEVERDELFNPSQKSPVSPKDECTLISTQKGAAAFRPKGSIVPRHFHTKELLSAYERIGKL